jgi:hypothetical protein
MNERSAGLSEIKIVKARGIQKVWATLEDFLL